MPDETPAPTPTGRDRLREALLKPTRGQVAVGVLLAGLGYAGVTQVRAHELDNTYADYREQDLIAALNGLNDAGQRAEAEITRLERQRRDLTDDTLRRQAALDQAQRTADTLDILAGTVPVHGPGIKVTITEGDAGISVDSLLDTVQALRAAGAESIEFNDQVRVVAQTAFSETTTGVTVGDTVLRSPIVIGAIGPPHTLSSSGISFPQGPMEQFEADGATVTVEELDDIRIDSVRNSPRPDDAGDVSGQ